MTLKYYKKLTVIVAIVMLPAWAFAANKFAPLASVAGENNTVTVPLSIANEDGVIAIDIPLKFSEGVTLKAVTFEKTRVENFDLKISKIDNEKHTVVIGLIHQMSAEAKQPLAAGEGAVANLVFEVTDPAVTEIRIDKDESAAPAHDLVFVYNTRSQPGQYAFDETHLDFAGVTVALSTANASSLPTEYALQQNYPNPFNPDTQIGFALPVDSDVELSIFNVLGQKVTTLAFGKMPAGNHTVTWKGTDSDGGQVASGVYFYRISADNFAATKKMMLLK
jgi:methionine-rich copper-binding protein CopC